MTLKDKSKAGSSVEIKQKTKEFPAIFICGEDTIQELVGFDRGGSAIIRTTTGGKWLK